MDNDVSVVLKQYGCRVVEMNNVTTLIKQRIVFFDKGNKCKATNLMNQTVVHNY